MLSKLQLSDEHATWLEDVRKIPSELASEMGVVSKGKDLAFEYRRSDLVLYRKFRTLDKSRHWAEPAGVSPLLWNEDTLTEESNAPLIITEGEFDALAFLASGATRVVSVPNGAPAKEREHETTIEEDRQFAYLWRDGALHPGLVGIETIILATDADGPGRILRDELAIRLGRTRCWYVTYPKGCKDANDVLVKHGPDALQDLIADAKPIVANKLVSFSEIPERADKQYSTGWGIFDRHFRLTPPQLILVTGVPNHGKSEWALAMCANFARLHGLKGAILQFEDTPDRNRRTLLTYAKAWSGTQQSTSVRDEPAVWVDRMFKTISPSEELNEETTFDLAWLKTAIEEAATRHGCKWVLIDPWNEIESMWGKGETEAIHLNRALRELKRLARRFQIAIILVAHPTREAEHWSSVDEASLYHVNGGAAWRNKIDLGVIVFAKNIGEPERWIRVAKSRDFKRNGTPGKVEMTFDANRSTYSIK